MEEPLNIKLLDVDKFIQENNVKRVSSSFVKLPSENTFHPEGLFSEEIFGQIASDERLARFGYIKLNTKVFHPRVYKLITKLKSFYAGILNGSVQAKFDQQLGDFVRTSIDDESGQSGFQFFITNFPNMKFKITKSLTRNDKVRILQQAIKDGTYVIDKFLVLPAGVRDHKDEFGTETTDEINKFYMSIINYAAAIPSKSGSNPVFDSVRFSLQKKIVQTHDYINDMMQGKSGFVSKKYGRRALALGTRNVISAADMSANDGSDLMALKADETKLPLFQAMKAFQPLVVNKLKLLFFSQIFDESSDQIGVLSHGDMKLSYQPINSEEKEQFMSSAGIEKLITLYRDPEYRKRAVEVHSDDGKSHYLFVIYDEGDKITVLRNVSEFKQRRLDNSEPFDESRLRPLTWMEAMFMATHTATKGKHVLVTRYPVLGVNGTFPSKVHLISTSPGRIVRYTSPYSNEENEPIIPEYPNLKYNSVDSVVVHPARLEGLGGDYDGDTVSVNGIMSEEANNEIANYLQTKSSILDPNGNLRFDLTGGGAELIGLTLFNLSREK